MPSVNDALRASISRVKSSSRNSPQKYACILGRETALLINPNAKLINDAKKEVGSANAVTGDCYHDGEAFIFETAGDPPASLARAIKACLAKHAGLTASVETRKAGTGEEESEESETEEPLKAKVTAHVKTLQSRVASLAKTNPQKLPPIQAKISQANTAFKSNHFEEAEQFLKEAEELL